ncbi:hypothetical protein BX600DRAFT_383216 [Xylariales sp. PMI_506]|nr:hypothetical protein BX600DRAFT_383216 [Xylariales sp. PMI_506]
MAAESTLRMHQLKQEVDRANALTPPRATRGLFRASCATDLLFLIDTTTSMNSYIDAAKEQVKSIMGDIKTTFLNEADVRVAVVGYTDHGNTPSIHFLDFTPSASAVHAFLDGLKTRHGADFPEDVLGGIQQALAASWKQANKLIIHIADAPPHGETLHDFGRHGDNYFIPGSEPHGLTYEPLVQQLVQLKINYALLRINTYTDRMAYAFSRIYGASGADVKLHQLNKYFDSSKADTKKGDKHHWSGSVTKRSALTGLQFEELQLGTTYGALRHLIIKTTTSSASRTATRLSLHPTTGARANRLGSIWSPKRSSLYMSAIQEKESDDAPSTAEVRLEDVPPQWFTPGWLDRVLRVKGFCPEVVTHSAATLDSMMAADENIQLSNINLTIHARSRPFAKGAVRMASYARSAASTSLFVVKSFQKGGRGLPHLVEDMRCQALCKAFAVEFNGLVGPQHAIDFIATMCLETQAPGSRGSSGRMSLEPFLSGQYVKYNSNSGFVMEESPDHPFNQTAQAFSHFTFERSRGQLLVNDLQGVGRLLTDPSIQTLDTNRFKLNDTNLNQDGFKLFFAFHQCNDLCRQLGLKSNKQMFVSGRYAFRDRWPSTQSTVCCSNKLCRSIIPLASALKSDQFPGFNWCNACWLQLQSTTTQQVCAEPGQANHHFAVSRFFSESQGQPMAKNCSYHIGADTRVSRPGVQGGQAWESA